VQRRREKLARTLAGELAAEDRELTELPEATRRARKGKRNPAADETLAEGEPGHESSAISKARNISPPAAIVRQHRSGRSSLEEAILETYHAHMSLHEIEAVAHELWGDVVSAAAISEFRVEIANRIRAWLGRRLVGAHPYVFLEAIQVVRRSHEETPPARVLAAVGVDVRGYREVLGVADAGGDQPDAWSEFLAGLKGRGLRGVQLFVGPGRAGLAPAVSRHFPAALLQCSLPQFWLEVAGLVTEAQVYPVTELIRCIHATDHEPEARSLAADAGAKLDRLGLGAARALLADAIEPTFSYFRFPPRHWRYIRSNDLLRRVARVVRERARVLGSVTDGDSAVMAVAAHLRQVARSNWQHRRFLDMAE
jgi:putative transposase